MWKVGDIYHRINIYTFCLQAQQVQPAASQVQTAVTQTPAAPTASQHYNQASTTGATYSSSQVPTHYSQGYAGYQQGTYLDRSNWKCNVL